MNQVIYRFSDGTTTVEASAEWADDALRSILKAQPDYRPTSLAMKGAAHDWITCTRFALTRLYLRLNDLPLQGVKAA
jgi:hypothetical protein